MEATSTGGAVTLSMTVAEAVVLHILIASSEFAEDLDVVELPGPVDKKVMSDIQQVLAPLIPQLGTNEYRATVDAAYATIDAGPFRTPR